MTRAARPIAVDIFCGAGGMSLGFEKAGFHIAAAVDCDLIHVQTHAANFPGCRTLRADVSCLTAGDIRTNAGLLDTPIHVLIGGAPCQGFSVIGKRRFDDSRNLLLSHFARLVAELQPSYFVLENVAGLLIGDSQHHLRSFVQRVEASGYAVVQPVRSLDAAEFGVPQRRRRVFVLGYLRQLTPIEYPQPRFDPVGDGGLRPPTVWDAIRDLPEVDHFPQLLVSDTYEGPLGTPSQYARTLRGENHLPDDYSLPREACSSHLTGCLRTVHTSHTIHRFEATRPGTYEPVTRFYRLSTGGLAPTLRAGTDQSGGSFTAPRPIHPISPRCITVREAARLHSFPDWFRFHPTKWHGFRQVGNAVPPLLAHAVAKSVHNASQEATTGFGRKGQ